MVSLVISIIKLKESFSRTQKTALSPRQGSTVSDAENAFLG